ncbi:pyruvate dehydrogenase (acetyl-transferring) E1 component subunit alpha [Candidatus Nanohalobium constans]|uniref:Pyruvate dehydrogenase E1 component alpha subunit n=1 Tax=Candidatus Nanohalobium constans TaxID=2565781 RepID=A0A5Q0UG83_9ARCH|nr:pyruvate dehydrogenase (acetyl-transferring) E1 component subunit alpha [Candidatus Nanohalobium constans]QGA79965.1 pyruvate dehydrogenase E1 component alpha subunit [Candidatus Nanohalobium constans]
MREEVYSGSIQRIEVMGTDDDDDFPWVEEDEYRELYKQMVLARKFDEKAFSLQRRGEISTYAPHKGQEAAQIGAMFALDEDDWMAPSFRETAAFIARGAPLDKIFQRWMGDANGQAGLSEMNTLPVAIPVGTQNLHTAGIGMAMEKKGDENAVLGFTGDGSTSQGDFHESLNFSGVYNAHSIFFVQNNQYAISMPREKQTKSETIAQKALAYGIDGIQVDGNDILAVIKAVEEALEKARSGEPVLIEAETYRLEDHTTSDDSTRYRDEEEVEEWSKKDPLKRFKEYLKDHGIWTDELEEFEEEAENRIDEAAQKAIEMDDPDIEELFDYVYGDNPDLIEKQKEQWMEAQK